MTDTDIDTDIDTELTTGSPVSPSTYGARCAGPVGITALARGPVGLVGPVGMTS